MNRNLSKIVLSSVVACAGLAFFVTLSLAQTDAAPNTTFGAAPAVDLGATALEAADLEATDLQVVPNATLSLTGLVIRGCALSPSVSTLPSCAALFGTPCSTPGATVRCRSFDDACERPRVGVFDLVCQ
jgi:hypothetical protein